MANFVIPELPGFNLEVRKLEPADRAHADLFNAIFQQILNNQAYLHKNSGATAGDYEALKNTVEQHIRSVTMISHAEIDNLGGMEPGEGGTGGTGGSCDCESISDADIQRIIDTIIANGSGTGEGGTAAACQCTSITAEEIQLIVEEMKRTGKI